MTKRTQCLPGILAVAFILIITQICVGQPADANDSVNLAPNPSFEKGTDGNVADWRFWNYAPEGEPRTSEGVWDDSVARTGTHSLKVINKAEKDLGTWTNRRGDGFIPVEPGSIYTVSAYFMVESADPVMTTNFRVGFCTIDDNGEVTYMPKEKRVQVSGEDRRFTEANTWKQLALVARVPEGATHLGMDIDLIGTGTGWIDDVRVVKGYDAAAFGGEMPSPRITITEAPDLDPPSAQTPLSVTFEVESPLAAREMTLECEVLDYWFRPSIFTEDLQLEADEVRTVTIDFDEATRERLFHMRCTAAANRFQVTAVLHEDGEKLAQARNNYSFRGMMNEYETLPALEGEKEYIDEVFGSQRLVDVVRCYDPDDPHPYMEGGRGLASKSTGAVPQIEWKDMFREPHDQFTTIETMLGKQFRVTHGWGWFGYKLNRKGLEPGKYYVAVLEYPEDTGRTYTVFNTGTASSAYGGYGFHTGRTLGDHWTRTLNSEYTDYPLSEQIQRWYSVFRLPEDTWQPGGNLRDADASEGFWFVVGGIGASQDPLAAGAAVRTIKLYEIDDVQALFPQIEEPPLEVGRRNLFLTNESDGISKFLTNASQYDLWALTRLYELKFMGMNGIAPNSTKNIEPLLRVNHEEALGLKIFPRMMIEREFLARIGVPPEGIAKDSRGLDVGRVSSRAIDKVPDLLHPATARGIKTLMTEDLGPWLKYPEFAGMMLYKHYGSPFPVSFSEYAMDLFEQETGETVEGDDPQARRDWLLANLKEAYYDWWYAKKHDFMMELRNHLLAMRKDLDTFYFAWHSDDDYPFSCGRLRYSSAPMMDKIYVPGTNILLVPSFTVPPEKWTEEQKRQPYLTRNYYREKIAPELEGKITMEDVLYGRYKDMPEFWGAPRSGELPHLVYPEDLDLPGMLREPGGIYANKVGYKPELYRDDTDFVYWAPVRYRFTADDPELLNMFRTGEGAAVAVHMPYNEETSHRNVPGVHGAHGVEHGGPFCMMEEVLSMAHCDPTHVMDSMWEPLKRGFPQYARAFAKAYRALPAMESTVLNNAISPANDDIVVRSYETDYGHYLALIHTAFDLQERDVTLTVRPAVSAVERIENLGIGETLEFADAGDDRIAIALTLAPMSLTSLRVVDSTPEIPVRDVRITPDLFSPDDNGYRDTVTVTGGTVTQVEQGRWTAEIRDGDETLIRRFAGEIPELQFTWDGTDENGDKCPDGEYEIVFSVSQFPDITHRRTVTLDTTEPAARPVLDEVPDVVHVNNLVITGQLVDRQPGDTLYVRQQGFEDRMVPLGDDGTFAAEVEALNLGDNTLGLVVRNSAGNTTGVTITVRFEIDPTQTIGFDFGAGPIAEGFSAIRNETFYSEERGYGWVKYGNVWKGDRGVGDDLIRDYCSGKQDREWITRIPNGEYTVTVVMVDTMYPHFAPDIYLEGEKVFENTTIRANDPLRVSFDVEVTDGVLDCEFINPDEKLPFFALNGIIIEPK